MVNVIFKGSKYPVFQNIVCDTREEALNFPQGDIVLVQDERTGIIHNIKFDSRKVIYSVNYHNEQENSHVFQGHLSSIAAFIERYIGKKNLLEIGCGNGYFLEKLITSGFEIEGMDPSYTGDNPRIKKEYFNGTDKLYDGFILRHVLEHVPNPYDFLCSIKRSNKHNGLIYIEVPCFDWINDNCEFVDIFYEHVNYFRKLDFFNLFHEIIAIDYSFGGQYLNVVARLSSLRDEEDLESNEDVLDFELNERFFDKLDRLSEIIKRKSKVLVWGGGSKGCTLLHLLDKQSNIDLQSKIVCVDINHLKKNKFLPITGCKIFSPTDFFEEIYNDMDSLYVVVMNRMYSGEIIDKINNAAVNEFFLF